MTLAEQIRQIMLSEELSGAEKLDSLHALIPADVCKIDNLNQATPAELKRLPETMADERSPRDARPDRLAELQNTGYHP